MGFGLKNAPKCFQRIMVSILGDLPFVKIFLDDVLIFSADIQVHSKHLTAVFSRLYNAGCKINFDKSSFNRSEVTYLGFYVDANGVKADVSKEDWVREEKGLTTRKK